MIHASRGRVETFPREPLHDHPGAGPERMARTSRRKSSERKCELQGRTALGKRADGRGLRSGLGIRGERFVRSLLCAELEG